MPVLTPPTAPNATAGLRIPSRTADALSPSIARRTPAGDTSHHAPGIISPTRPAESIARTAYRSPSPAAREVVNENRRGTTRWPDDESSTLAGTDGPTRS